MLGLHSPLRQIPRLQPAIAKKFEELGLMTLHDALFYFPFRHEDWRKKSLVADVSVGQDVTLEATVLKISARRAWRRRGMSIVDITVIDDQESKFHAVWFNLPFLAKTLKIGDRIFLSGKIVNGTSDRLQLNNPLFEKVTANEALHEKMVPVYRSTEGLSQRQIRLVMKQAVALANVTPDPLPPGVSEKLEMPSLPEALTNIHFPATPELGHQAVQRLKFDELLAWHLHMHLAQEEAGQAPAPRIPFHEMEIRSFVQALPFDLTSDQRIAAWQILQDITETTPMSRLVQGDVGSGKTVVAALVGYNAALSHYQVALVAPTVVLAQQHWQTFQNMLASRGTSIGLLTGSEAKMNDQSVSRSQLLSAVRQGQVDILIGTHALLRPEVHFSNLGLVIVDEQQRFGVDQRQALVEHQESVPHFLSLTATPIPRSFALWLSGILSISSIKTKPLGRSPITTEVIGPHQRQQVARAMTETVGRGEQVYVITPLIEESDSLGVRAATTEYARLQQEFPAVRIGLLHGALPATERSAVLDKFRDHQFDVLVSTTVIEVGVDVPSATLMVIEGAERFGLAQLHQLRGRVGRSTLPSSCLLVTDKNDPSILPRLQTIASTNDGFAIAELDMKERGAGDLYGQRQSGLPTWQLASLDDTGLFKQVRDLVASLNRRDQELLAQKLCRTEDVIAAFHPE